MSELEAPPQKPGIMVRAFLIVLPVGLAFMVPISLWIYYQKKYAIAPATSQYAAMLRRDLNADDFARYVRILTQEVGERSLSQPANLEAAAAFVESTLGFDNMGFAVQRLAFESNDRPLVNLVAELPGNAKPGEEVLVLAAYDGEDASGISAMMCVAHALTGTAHARTIRFAAVVNARESDPGANGLEKLAQTPIAGGRVVRTVVAASPLERSLPTAWQGAVFQKFPEGIQMMPGSSLEDLEKLKAVIEQASDQP